MNYTLFAVGICVSASLTALAQQRVEITPREADKRVDVTIDGKPFTAYIFPGPAVLKKTALYPIRSAGGHFITRGWPLDPRPGERVDHPHHVGMWLNFGDVNGHDFWNNSIAIDPSHKGPFGTIVHTGIKSVKSGHPGQLTVTANWLDKDGKPMLEETTTFTFRGDAASRTIDRQTTLKAIGQDVVFTDNKEGMVALRMARALELPSNKPEVFTDAKGVATPVPALNNDGVTGHYLSSEGITDDAVWGTRGRWMCLSGQTEGEDVAVVLFDHPKNVGYPTYWHARGYGLFAANPLAPSVMTNGKAPALNYTLPNGQSVTFRYRLLIQSGKPTAAALNQLADQFSR